jgi:Rad3-related DNA helicase
MGKIDLESLKNCFRTFRGVDFRKYQSEAIERVLKSKKRVVVVNAPTGSGKSLIGMSVLAGMKEGIYVVHSKSLQDQIAHDFPESKILKGKANYPCVHLNKLTSDKCPNSRTWRCPDKPACKYEIAKAKCLAADYKILNYAYLLAECNYVGKFSNQPMIVLDEGDLLEGILSNWITLRISESRLKKLKIKMPKYKTSKYGLADWQEWVDSTALPSVAKYISILEAEAKQYDAFEDHEDETLDELRQLNDLNTSLQRFKAHVDSTWILNEIQKPYGNTWEFKPLYPPKRATQDYLLRHADRFLILSATLPPPMILSELTGIPIGDIDFIEIPSTFPAENRRIIIHPVANITHKTIEIEAPKLIQNIEHIISLHPNEKGLIHSVSYKLADLIKPISPRIVVHNGQNRQEVLESFQQSPKPLILLSPSMERGVNLPEDQCRFVIWAKCPYESLADKMVSSRLYGSPIGPYWYKSLAAQTIIQGSGRGIRSESDTCTIYLLDAQIDKLISEHPNLFPAWWRESLEL